MTTRAPGASGAQQAPRQQSQQRQQSTVEWAQQSIAGSFADASEAAERLKLAAQRCHLVGGASICPLVEGHEIVLTVVPINLTGVYPGNPSSKVLKTPGGTAQLDPSADPPKWGIGKGTLMTLAAAAGVEWTYSRRQDDGRHPLFCHWRAKGRYRQIDGTWRGIEGDRDVDLRDGSAQLNGKSEREIVQLRQNVVRSAITKAKLRAIREAFGLEHGLPTDELYKPFVFARMIFTGRSADPKVRRLFAAVIAQQQLAATAALYGPAVVPQLGAGPSATTAVPTPASFQEELDIDEEDASPDSDDAPTHRAAPAPPPPAPVAPAAGAPHGTAPTGAGGRSAGGPSGSELFMPGKKPQPKIRDAEDKDLAYWSKRLSDDLAKGKVAEQYVARTTEQRDAIVAEIALRARGGVEDSGPMSPEDIAAAEAMDRGEDEIPY